MTDAPKPYPRYKDSGVPWLGRVPAHWEVRRQRNIVSMLVSNVDKHTIEGEIPIRLCNYVDVYKHDVITDRIPFMRATASKAEIDRFGLKIGDVVITKDSETWDDIGVPALVTYEAPDFVCGYHLAILRPRQGIICGGFLLRALQSQGVAAQFYISANGVTRFGLSQDAIKSVWVPLPPLKEQRAIVAFLDHYDRLTRRYIRAQRRLIELLTEQKQALIQRAVTRGLDPDVPLKDSGIEWLGEIPEHWEKTSIKRLFVEMDYGTSESLSGDGMVRVLTMGHIQDGEVILPESGCLDEVPLNLYLDHSDLLFNRTNSPELVGKVGIFRGLLSDRVSFASYLVRLRVRPIYSAEYINYLLNSPLFWSYARSQALISLHQANLNATRYGQMLVPLPPSSEQATTASYLNDRIRNIADGIAATNRQIDLLREYRTRLIADVVTGKLDVRAVSLPDLDTDQTAFDDEKNIADYDDLDEQETDDDES